MRMAADVVSWPFAAMLCGLCWLSGALVGYAVRLIQTSTTAEARRKKPRRRRRSSYYFSEDERSWSDGRLRTGLAWVSAVLIMIGLIGAGTIALANYKSRPNAAAGYRH